ncbi:MAG: DEAD/DEAH box helicase [Promethearchaeota archaeon]
MHEPTMVTLNTWKIRDNKLICLINIKRNVMNFFKEYLSHRLRLLYAQHKNFLIPKYWSFSENKLELIFFDKNILYQVKNPPTKLKFNDFESLRDYEIIPALKTFYYCCKHKFFGFSPFFPINGKWIPPVSFVTRIKSENLKEKDFEHIKNWIESQKKLYANIMDKEQSDYLDLLVDSIIKEDNDNIETLLNKGKLHESESFLDLLVEAELFWKIREIYKYKILKPHEIKNYGISMEDTKENLVFEVNRLYKDPDFGKIQRPTVQELWDKLMENSHTTRLLCITHEAPNPLRKMSYDKGNLVFIEWIRVHPDQQIIFVKKLTKKIPYKGFFYVYDNGELDQFEKKRRFISYSKDHPVLQQYLHKRLVERTPLLKNKWPRNILTQQIIKNHGIFAVQGPPGTGKTYLATEVVEKYLSRKKNAKILVCSKEHQSLNHILKKITDLLINKKIPFRAYRSISYHRLLRNNYEEHITQYFSNNILKQFNNFQWSPNAKLWSQFIEPYSKEQDLRNKSLAEKSANIFFCTTMDSAFYHILNNQSYDLVIIEEAGKCYPSELFHTLTLGQNVLMIGDQNQLPPFEIKETEKAIVIWEDLLRNAIHNKKRDESLYNRFGFRYTLIRDYFKKYGAISKTKYKWLKPFETLFNLLPAEKKHILNEEFRMEKELSDIIGKVFYKQKFIHKKKPSFPLSGIIPQEYNYPLLWIDTPHCIKVEEAGEDPEKTGERINIYELNLIILYLKRLKPKRKIDLVILTPYNDQKDLFLDSIKLKTECDKISEKKFEEIIRTIDEYQGAEADLTIISLVRNNTLGTQSAWGFMTESPRLNVMFSRSKSRQVIVGCSEHIIRNKDEPENKYLLEFYEEYKKVAKFIPAEVFMKNG